MYGDYAFVVVVVVLPKEDFLVKQIHPKTRGSISFKKFFIVILLFYSTLQQRYEWMD
jgi:hypothetical protein